jgi:hypothetical protein
MKRSYAYIAAAAALAVSAMPAHAATQTFAQFLQQTPGDRLFTYTKLDSGANKKAEIKATDIPVYFIFGALGLPADLTGLQNSTLTVDFVSNLGTTGTGSSRSQLFDSLTAGSISFVRTTAAAEGNGTRTNLLTVSFTNAQLDASQGDGAFTFKSTPGSSITFTSDFLDFSKVIEKDFSFSFSGSSPTFDAPLGSSSRSLTASGSGTFASEPLPSVPEPASWAMMLGGFGLLGAALRTRKSQLSYSA